MLVDVATLTGAVKVALGLRTAGLMTDDDALAERLSAAAKAAGERLWRLPLEQAYRPGLDSEVADVGNVTHDEAEPGADTITAALFLQPAAGGVPWAHLDVAGVGRTTKGYDDATPLTSGWGVRTLLELVERSGS